MTLLLAAVSIKNLNEVPLTDASANQIRSDLGFGQIV